MVIFDCQLGSGQVSFPFLKNGQQPIITILLILTTNQQTYQPQDNLLLLSYLIIYKVLPTHIEIQIYISLIQNKLISFNSISLYISMSNKTQNLIIASNIKLEDTQKLEQEEDSRENYAVLMNSSFIREVKLEIAERERRERSQQYQHQNSSSIHSSANQDSQVTDEQDENLQQIQIEFEQQQDQQNPSNTESHQGQTITVHGSGGENSMNDSQGLIQKTIQKDDEEINSSRYRRRGKKNRKVRTTITRDKLAMMNQIFAEYTKQKQQGKNPRHNLKEIGNQLSLGYSTILHKYREFRSAKVVKGGALIASLQKKRKYKKSIHIERTIEQALQKQSFYTAVELSQYIFRQTKKKFSRSIISRHLGQMGYSYKNLKISPIQKNKPKYKENRRIYASIIIPFIKKNYLLVYIDQFALSISTFMKKKNGVSSFDKYQNTQGDYVSVIVGASIQGILNFSVKHGFFTRREFCQCITSCFESVRSLRFMNRFYQIPQKSYLITDMNKIHLDPEGQDEEKPIAKSLNRCHAHRLFLPPASPQLNPLDSIFTNLKHRLQKRDIRGHNDLRDLMQKNMRQISKEPTQIYFKDVLTSLQRSKLQQNL